MLWLLLMDKQSTSSSPAFGKVRVATSAASRAVSVASTAPPSSPSNKLTSCAATYTQDHSMTLSQSTITLQYNKQKLSKHSSSRQKKRGNNNNSHHNHNNNNNDNTVIDIPLDVVQQQQQQQQQQSMATATSSSKKKKNKIDITHLLVTRPTYHHPNYDEGHLPTKKGNPNQSARQYLKSNYYFKVNPYGNYQSTIQNPASLVAWNKIEQVLYLQSTESLACPICFETPVAPRVSRCGHIVCYGCLLRTLSDNNRCPVCLRPTNESDLKSVYIKRSTSYRPGDTIELRLLKFKEGTTIPYLYEQQIPDTVGLPMHNQENAIFSRFSIIENIDDIVQSEREQLATAKEAALTQGEFETVRYLSMAEKQVEDRLESFRTLTERKHLESQHAVYLTSIPRYNPNRKTSDPLHHYHCSNNNDIKYALQDYYYLQEDWEMDNMDEQLDWRFNSTSSMATSASMEEQTSALVAASDAATDQQETGDKDQDNIVDNDVDDDKEFTFYNTAIEGVYYYYQSTDGQPIYLHPSLSMETHEITAHSKYKALSMLAPTTQITFVTLTLPPSLQTDGGQQQ
ncbi:hypothetical protein SAMD00019534_077160 [Acytostelium subglobosum LB1]|uniref:hypothetical protein n=1 Tax=Acytostelium subglobosum LB1 TaxID=1410327 RepID=UPI00064488D3|nr:hypothetical protein SAMD00019534_077160 [Acytostelium subglobosum LB1]GAM24541.1 hypothetical protein SAMD00019534_077160 [Acytostelium subglobosum LB1]|eukprot:XP_012752867.1 hypothetical protein SAMD00019534_077160 [Acytostelium subglobosum LB1]